MSVNSRILPNYTYKDYYNWEGSWEIIDGIAHAMSPSTLPIHQKVCNKLGAAFDNALSDDSCNCEAYQPIDIKITENTVVQPDALIVCKPIKKAFLDFPPALVAEVLSPSTALKDRNTKFELYQNFGIKYYLIIDPKEKTIEVYVLGKNKKYKLKKNIKSFDLIKGCSIAPDFSKLFN